MLKFTFGLSLSLWFLSGRHFLNNQNCMFALFIFILSGAVIISIISHWTYIVWRDE